MHIVREHRARYPLMQPQDFAKLAFQSEFGPEHMVTDAAAVTQGLLQEWESVTASDAICQPEPIGNGLCRFHLTAAYPPQEVAAVLARLFLQSAREHTGTQAGLDRRLTILESLPVREMRTWLTEYRQRGCPPVHHSNVYRNAYHPHYRVVLAPLAELFPTLLS